MDDKPQERSVKSPEEAAQFLVDWFDLPQWMVEQLIHRCESFGHRDDAYGHKKND